MAIQGIEQPAVIQIDESLRLRKFDGVYDFALAWYQDLDTVWLVDGDRVPYTPELEHLLGCKGVLTKAPIYAVERIKAIQKAGFVKSEHLLIGKTGYAYDGYWTI